MIINRVYALNALPTEVPDPISGNFPSIGGVFNVAFNLVVGVGFAWGFISITLGFIAFVMSSGNKDRVVMAWKRIQYGLYAIFIAFLAVTLRTIIVQMFTGSPFEITGFTTP